MICVTRRQLHRGMLAGGAAGVLAFPAQAKLAANMRGAAGDTRMGAVLLHDPVLQTGQRFAAAGEQAGGNVLAIDGDRIRFTHKVLGMKPALIVGLSRHADALLIADVAGEAGYVQVAELEGRTRNCTVQRCRASWDAFGRVVSAAEESWAEALASYSAGFGSTESGLSDRAHADSAGAVVSGNKDAGAVFGWVLAPRNMVPAGGAAL